MKSNRFYKKNLDFCSKILAFGLDLHPLVDLWGVRTPCTPQWIHHCPNYHLRSP